MIATFLLALSAAFSGQESAPIQVAGIYPEIAFFNQENECGVGGVVPWAGRLWVITYAPHRTLESTDKLYSIGPDKRRQVHPESVGGTAACRMIHLETQQLVLGRYVIDAEGQVRVIPPGTMPGRLTAVARHLEFPERKVYFATMEEGLYEVDLVDLAVRVVAPDNQKQIGNGDPVEGAANLPGYHGKGLYAGQGRLVYANNGEPGDRALRDPSTPSGCLAQWNGHAWDIVRRNQFTEVTGPGGLNGNANPGTDPVWSIGWDDRSLLLMCLHKSEWTLYRLPKGSHSYDGAHGWNTEWPRIRDVGQSQLLMTMHGTFWDFPKGFTPKSSRGIRPISNYLKVIGDFARFGESLVFGCDDVARSEFLNRRRAKGSMDAMPQSHSNLWFVDPDGLGDLGPALGRGAVWLEEAVTAGSWSDAYLLDGYDRRGVHLAHREDFPVRFLFQRDLRGTGEWVDWKAVDVPARGYVWTEFPAEETGAWVRLRLDASAHGVTAAFHYANRDERRESPAGIFAGLASDRKAENLGATLLVKDDALLVYPTRLAPQGQVELDEEPEHALLGYTLDANLVLRPAEATSDPRAAHIRVPEGLLQEDRASLIYVDDDGKRWRLPRGVAQGLTQSRLCREVVTERDLFHAGGTVYELPARNAGGFAMVRPIATHPFLVQDFASFRGLLVMSGIDPQWGGATERIVTSDDGKASVWVGVVDDLWSLGKPRGTGGPWWQTQVQAGEVSDPYLLTGFDRKAIALHHDADSERSFELEIDVSGTGVWLPWKTVSIAPNATWTTEFPPSFGAYWLRARSVDDCIVTLQLEYR